MLSRMPPSQAATLRRKGRKTGTGVMLKTVYAIAAAAIVAASFVGTLSLSPQVEARGSLPGVKADRADTRPLAKDCSTAGLALFRSRLLARHAPSVWSGPRGAPDFGGSPGGGKFQALAPFLPPAMVSGTRLACPAFAVVTAAAQAAFHPRENCAKTRPSVWFGHHDRSDRQLRQLRLQPGALSR